MRILIGLFCAFLIPFISFSQALLPCSSAKIQTENTQLRVRGTISSGVEGGSIRYICDNTGGIGVNLGTGGNQDWSNLVIGDSVEITGTLQFNNCVPMISSISSTTVLARNRAIPIYNFTINNASSAYTLRYLGCVVKIAGIQSIYATTGSMQQITNTWPTQTATFGGINYKLNNNNGLIYRVLAQSNIDGRPLPNGTFEVQGVMSRNVNGGNTEALCTQNLTGYQIIGRTSDDIIGNYNPSRVHLEFTNPRRDTTIGTNRNVNILISAQDSSGYPIRSITMYINRNVVGNSSNGTLDYNYTSRNIASTDTLTAIVLGFDSSVFVTKRIIRVSTNPRANRYSILQSKNLNQGDSLIIHGTLTNGNESNNSRLILDSSGGIGVTSAQPNQLLQLFSQGDSIEIKGIMAASNCLLQINATSIRLIAQSRQIGKIEIISDSIFTSQVLSEQNIGKVIRITKVRSLPILNNGFLNPTFNSDFSNGDRTYAINGDTNILFRIPNITFSGVRIPDSNRTLNIQGVLSRYIPIPPNSNYIPCRNQNSGYYILGRTAQQDFELNPLNASLKATNTRISIFPNPANGVTQITSLDTPLQHIEIRSTLGNTITSLPTNSNSTILSLDFLQAGLYLVLVKTENSETVLKLIVK